MPINSKDPILARRLELIGEQSSPLFRIMWMYNADESDRRQFDNNICAFHIGNGLVLSVAHNLRAQAGVVKSISQTVYEAEILPRLNPEHVEFCNTRYPLDYYTNKRYLNITDQSELRTIAEITKQIGFDTRWLTLSEKNICKPHLIIQFKNNQFYNDPYLTGLFEAHNYFEEAPVNRYTFVTELELVNAYYAEDIALYRIVNTHQDIVSRLPAIEPDFSLRDDLEEDCYCLQSSPSSEMGKLLNRAHIDGYLEHFGFFPDDIGGHYTFEGIRYLIRGYFRFGSSGAPYVFYDANSAKFKVNAVQSEACPIQLSIANEREGNYQYVNAIASPLNTIEHKMKIYLQGQSPEVGELV
jgi:hypothetical protein